MFSRFQSTQRQCGVCPLDVNNITSCAFTFFAHSPHTSTLCFDPCAVYSREFGVTNRFFHAFVCFSLCPGVSRSPLEVRAPTFCLVYVVRRLYMISFIAPFLLPYITVCLFTHICPFLDTFGAVKHSQVFWCEKRKNVSGCETREQDRP